MLEQQSEPIAQLCPSSVHSGFPHLPFQQPSEQQSIAFVHAPPSARHAAEHFVTFVWPCTGSHRPLQQSLFLGSQSSAAARHSGLSMHVLLGPQ